MLRVMLMFMLLMLLLVVLTLTPMALTLMRLKLMGLLGTIVLRDAALGVVRWMTPEPYSIVVAPPLHFYFYFHFYFPDISSTIPDFCIFTGSVRTYLVPGTC